jgi:hypothetical protein
MRTLFRHLRCSDLLTPSSRHKESLSQVSWDVPCEEQDRLKREYLEATVKVAQAGISIREKASPQWKEATRIARQVSRAALDALQIHRKEHGC